MSIAEVRQVKTKEVRMNRFTALVLSLAAASSSAFAQPASFAAVQPALAKNNCLACHAVDKKLVGPAYTEVAAKYKGDAKARAYLPQKIKAGGSGVWGPVAMPPNPQISDAEIKTVVDWILAGAPAK
jgi:cytochrome c